MIPFFDNLFASHNYVEQNTSQTKNFANELADGSSSILVLIQVCLLKRMWGFSPAQSRRHGGHTGAVPPTDCLCPPKRKLCPPKRGLCPEKTIGLGALERKSRSKLVSFVDLHKFLEWFFFGDHLFLAGKTTWNLAEKPLKIPISAGKSLWIFAPHLIPLIQTGMNFLCPRAPFEFTQNKLLVTPTIYFCPPVTLSWRRAYPSPGCQTVVRLDIFGITDLHVKAQGIELVIVPIAEICPQCN